MSPPSASVEIGTPPPGDGSTAGGRLMYSDSHSIVLRGKGLGKEDWPGQGSGGPCGFFVAVACGGLEAASSSSAAERRAFCANVSGSAVEGDAGVVDSMSLCLESLVLGTVENGLYGFPPFRDEPVANGFAVEEEGFTPKRDSPRFTGAFGAAGAGSALVLIELSSLTGRCLEASGFRRPRNALILPSFRRQAFLRQVQTYSRRS
jgi:hypothetical protein